MRKVRLANGHEFVVDRFGVTDEVMAIRVVDGNLLDLVLEFGRPENTATIEHWYEGTETDHGIYSRYTALKSASYDMDGVLMFLHRE